MKTLLAFLAFLPMAAAAQDKAKTEKPSTTDCPTWQNKPVANKAAYYQSLRHTKATPQDPQLAAIPKKEKPVKTAAAPKPAKASVPMFSEGPDKVMNSSTAPTAAAKPAEKEKTATPAKEENTAKARAAATAEKKPVKKKKDAASSGKVRGTSRSSANCPAF
jgi:hypothetical protein